LRSDIKYALECAVKCKDAMACAFLQKLYKDLEGTVIGGGGGGEQDEE
jgi:hypothetical protein